MSGWEWARFRTSARVRAAGAQVVLGGMCWPSMPLNWPGPLRWWASASTRIWRRQAPRAARPGRPPDGRAGGPRLTRRPGAGRNPARPRHPLADADARRVADLRSRRHDPRAARRSRTARATWRPTSTLEPPDAAGCDPGALLDSRDDAHHPRRLARDERPRRPQLQGPPCPPGLPLAGLAGGRPARRDPADQRRGRRSGDERVNGER